MATLKNTTIIDCTIIGDMNMQDARIHLNSDDTAHIVIGATDHLFEVLQEDEVTPADVRGRDAIFENLMLSRGITLPGDLTNYEPQHVIEFTSDDQIAVGDPVSIVPDATTGEAVVSNISGVRDFSVPVLTEPASLNPLTNLDSLMLTETTGVLTSTNDNGVGVQTFSIDYATSKIVFGSRIATGIVPVGKVDFTYVGDSHFVIVIPSAKGIHVFVGEVAVNTITLGPEYTISGNTRSAVTNLSDNMVLVGFQGTNGQIRVQALSIDTTTRTCQLVGSAAVLAASSGGDVKIRKLSSTKAIAVFADGGLNNYGVTAICDLDPATNLVTVGPKYTVVSQILTETPYMFDVDTLNENLAMIAYRLETVDGAVGMIRRAQIAGDTITLGPESVFTDHVGFNTVVLDSLTENRFLIVYSTYNASSGLNDGEIIVGSFDPVANDFVINDGTPFYEGGYTIDYLCSASFGDNFNFLFRRGNLSTEGYGGTFGYTSNVQSFFGFALNAGSPGDIIGVAVVGGVTEVLNNLIPGQKYYVTAVGDVSTTPTPWFVGYAITSNKLLVWK